MKKKIDICKKYEFAIHQFKKNGNINHMQWRLINGNRWHGKVIPPSNWHNCSETHGHGTDLDAFIAELKLIPGAHPIEFRIKPKEKEHDMISKADKKIAADIENKVMNEPHLAYSLTKEERYQINLAVRLELAKRNIFFRHDMSGMAVMAVKGCGRDEGILNAKMAEIKEEKTEPASHKTNDYVRELTKKVMTAKDKIYILTAEDGQPDLPTRLALTKNDIVLKFIDSIPVIAFHNIKPDMDMVNHAYESLKWIRNGQNNKSEIDNAPCSFADRCKDTIHRGLCSGTWNAEYSCTVKLPWIEGRESNQKGNDMKAKPVKKKNILVLLKELKAKKATAQRVYEEQQKLGKTAVKLHEEIVAMEEEAHNFIKSI